MRYLRGERVGRPWADLLEVLDADGIAAAAAGPTGTAVDATGAAVGPVDPVEFVLSDMSGWVVSGPVGLGEQLLHRGATVLRHAHTMELDLIACPPSADWAQTPLRSGFRTVPCDRDAEELFPAKRAAFAPGHPDHSPELDDQSRIERLAALLAGKDIGPVLPCSRLVVDDADQVVAGAILTNRDGLPWIASVFRHPDLGYPGLGGDLLRLVLADVADRGLTEVGLAVSEGNQAQRLYEKLGFRLTNTSLTVIVP
ncbi:GNAT family N-acetyltransferase [Kitasatospora sp. NPDC087315]|uniref:GNAT family N-acetyltransferase n=1 Tax=Kitasatospora sp. NPDC087315 TaxID=3364069 RepID=UPI0038253A98